jgi:hypothetical protein
MVRRPGQQPVTYSGRKRLICLSFITRLLGHRGTHLFFISTQETFSYQSPMYVTRVSAKSPLSRQTAAQLSRAAASFAQSHAVSTHTPGLHLTSLHIQPQQSQSRRPFSSTSRTKLREYFPEPETEQIVKTETAFEHPLYVSSLLPQSNPIPT